MRRRNWIWIAFVLFVLTAWGCAGTGSKALTENQTLLAAKSAKGYLKKIAMVQTPVPVSAFDRNAADLFFNTLVETIRKEDDTLQLVTSKEEGLPDLMVALSSAKTVAFTESLSSQGRSNGFNGLVTTALHSVRVVPYKSGWFWFRSTKYRLKFDITIDIYDPFTGAKILSMLEERSKKISASSYEDYKQDAAAQLEEMDDALKKLAESIGQKVAETMADQPWQAAVAQVDGQRIVLSTGRHAGLRAGERLAVVVGQRTLTGPGGETFVVPGPKIDMITISKVTETSTEAIADIPGKIKIGDIAVQIK